MDNTEYDPKEEENLLYENQWILDAL